MIYLMVAFLLSSGNASWPWWVGFIIILLIECSWKIIMKLFNGGL